MLTISRIKLIIITSIFALMVIMISGLVTAQMVTLRVMHTTPKSHPAYKITAEEFYKKFMERHPEVKIEEVLVPWEKLEEKIIVAVAGGEAPDVIRGLDDQRSVQYAALGAFIPLNKFIEKEKYPLDDFYKAALATNTWNGKLYGVPYYWDARMLFYNKAHFREVGLDPNSPPVTWRDLEQYADKLTKRDAKGHILRLGFMPHWGNSWLYIYGWLNGGEFVDMDRKKVTINTPPIVEALEWIVKMADKYGGAQLLTELSLRMSRPGISPFQTQGVSMIIHESGFEKWQLMAYPDLKIDFGVAKPPYNTTPATWSGVLSVVIPRGSKHPDLAWEFAKMYAEEESQLRQAEGLHLLPTRKSAASAVAARKFDPVLTFAAQELLPISRVRPPIPVSQKLWDELVRATEVALYKKATPKEALDRANEAVQKAWDEFKSVE